MAELSHARGIDMRILLIPELHLQTAGDHPFADVRVQVMDAVAASAVPVLDLAPAFDGLEPSSLWVSASDAHPNARAHEIMARHIHAEWGPAVIERVREKSPRRGQDAALD